MALPSGSYRLGPDDATLLIKTGRTGPMAKLGHDLDIRVNAWSAELELAEEPSESSLTVEVDSSSLQVLGAADAPDALSDGDRSKIAQTINEHIFKGRPISFVSNRVEPHGEDGTLSVFGQLNLLGTPGPIAFTLRVDADGHLSANATVIQTAFDLKPHSAMKGALRLTDEVKLEVDGHLPVS
jgi:polyisoprenoid-binding protein YceI